MNRLGRHRLLSSLLLTLACLVISTPAAAQETGDTTIVANVDQLVWLSGCWEVSRPGFSIEEQWTAPRGGTLIGLNRVVRGDATVAYEHLMIRQTDSAVVFMAYPSGQAPTEFRATALAEGHVVFENPAHDFPRRISYSLIAPDSLLGVIDDGSGGNRGQFPYVRVACGAGRSP